MKAWEESFINVGFYIKTCNMNIEHSERTRRDKLIDRHSFQIRKRENNFGAKIRISLVFISSKRLI